MKRLVLVLALAWVGNSGCASIKESDRQLNYQNKWAGKYVEDKATDPDVKQAGRDVRLNSEALEKTMGLPEKPAPYTAQNSAAAREAREIEHRKRWYDYILPGIVALVCGSGLFGIARKLAPTFLAGPAGTALSAMIEGVENVKESMDASPDKKVDWSVVAAELASVQDNAGVREFVRNQVAKVQEKLAK